MAGLDAALSTEIIAPVAGSALALGSLGAVGLAGVMDRFLGDDEEEPPAESATDGGDPVFGDADPAGDDAAGDEFAFDDGGGDAFDDFDVDGEEGDGGGGAGGLERRVDELEEEIASVSSTVSTVRTENEQISESVEEVEENVRKLLDIYKMVTKGVNPFVDQEGGDALAGSEDPSLGLFDEEDADEEQEDLDEEVTDADPDEFFDDDFEDEADEDETDEDETEASDADSNEGDDDPPADEEADQDMDHATDPLDDEAAAESGAKSFDDLREKYEEAPEWTEPDGTDPDAADRSDPDLSSMDTRIDRVDEPMDENVASALATGPGSAGSRHAGPGSRGRAGPGGAGGAGREKPYLYAVPGGYVADLIVMEWVEFLVTVGGPDGAHRAITYYENVEWLVPEAADQLREFVEGHPETNADPEDDGGDPLSMDHHTRSLRYIARLNGDVHENVLDAWDEGDNRWLHR